MKRLRIGILDLVTKAPTRALYARVMNGNLASIMPQALAVWCEEAGHEVHFVCYTGFEDLLEELPKDIDILFVGAFTRSAQTAYAISNMFRRRGAVTVLGGPHARCYPEDARKYFDYVLGFTDKTVIDDVLRDCSRHRPLGLHMTAMQQPSYLPGVKERWKFIQSTLRKTATSFKVVPMIGSLGCPYTCSFCIDSVVDYQPMSYDQIREDLRFLLETVQDPVVGWHDPNFGIRFNDYLSVIEEAVPAGSISFIAESSLSLLSEKNVKRLSKAGFRAILPGIESWYALGNKSRTGRKQAEEKMRHVSDHLNMIMEHIPYVQVNFVLGLDDDQGAEPFELTKMFLDRTPGAFPAYSLLSAFGEAAPLNLELQREGRVLGFPFHFLNNNQAMNVRPKHYEWPEFYDYLIDLVKYSFSAKSIYRRLRANRMAIPRWMNVVRAISSEGWGRLKYHRHLRNLLDTDRPLRNFFEGETEEIPSFYLDRMKRELGEFWAFLPEGAIQHDQYAYLKKVDMQELIELPTLEQAS
ncbi:MAG: B12-binding domain-containing radical SAM protein [Rhodothermales bacterium]